MIEESGEYTQESEPAYDPRLPEKIKRSVALQQ